MFIHFFYTLREYGLNVSLDEWLCLMDALDRGLAGKLRKGRMALDLAEHIRYQLLREKICACSNSCHV